MCIFGEVDHVYDIRAHKDTLLIIELQCWYKDFYDRDKMDIFGWTLLELFDMKGDLMRGKWKVPFYSTELNPNVLVSQLKQLKSQSNTLLFMRIAWPYDSEFGT